jgi:ring-1,2-phenylacetyl-CoA epoxidase subunit PaaE
MSRFTLFYGNRASGTVMFREELADLKDLYLDRFNLVHVLSREAQDIELLHGRIDRQKAERLLAHWVDLDDIDTAFVCGPDGMMQAVAEALKARGFPEARIRIERFATSIPHHEHKPQTVDPARAECEVTVIIDGATKSFMLDRAKENIIDAGLATASSFLIRARAACAPPAAPSLFQEKWTWTSTSRSRITRSLAASCSPARAIRSRIE